MANPQYENMILTSVISSALNTRLACLLQIESIMDNDATSMRIREEFLVLRGELLTAADWYCPPVVDPSPMDLMQKQFYLLKKEQLALAKELKREVLKEKELAKIKLPLHQKLYKSYIDVKYLEEDVREEALVGAPAPWMSSMGPGTHLSAPIPCTTSLQW